MMDGTQLSEAAKLLSDAGDFGCIWADEALIAQSRMGRLAERVPVGEHICHSIPALFGFDGEIFKLRKARARSIELPNVAHVGAEGDSQRLNYVVRWNAAGDRVLVWICRTIAIDDVTVELQRETRRRMLAEAELVEQAKGIEQANAALREANESLNAFTRIISHDLKAPMRALRYFADDLEAALDGPEDTNAKPHLDRLKAQSQRMSSMITGLLAYTRLERTADGIESIDTRALVEQIVASLPRPETFSIDVAGHWPTIDTLRAPLDTALRNLVENAIKHHDSPQGRVEITAAAEGDELIITVADDGPGIAAQYQQAVFDPFTKLARDEDGLGMGLTLVRRACENIGGKLRLAGDRKQRRGCAFELTWPCRIATK